MPDGENDKLNRLERLKAKLFSKSYQTKIEYRDSFSDHPIKDVHQTWDEPKKEEEGKLESFFKNTSAFKKFFIFSIGFLALSLIYVGYMLFFGGNIVSNDNIEISIFGNTFTDGGETLPLKIEIINRNSSALELVDLVVEYPRGSEGDLSQDTERLRASLGRIAPGDIVNENVDVILFGQEGTIRPVRVSIEYRVEGSNSIFIKEKLYEVSINSAPVDISLVAPVDASPGQDVTLTAKVTLNAPREIENLLMRADYPFGFSFTSSTPKTSLGNNVWALGEMKPGEEREIKIVGRMVDVFDGEEKTFHVSAGLQSKSDKSLIDVVYNSLAHTISIERPFINLSLGINNEIAKEYSVPAKSPITGIINWKNNLGIPISDMSIRAKFSGNALNRRSLKSTDGFYNSSEDMIIWDRNSEDDLARVDENAQGAVSFSIAPNSLVNSSGDILIDPTIVVEVSVTGKQLLEGNIVKELQNSETKIIKVASEANLISKALYFSGPFVNTGSIPPKVEEETTYTIVWTITNTANNLTKAEVKSTLPNWMRFTGNVLPASEDLVYNAASREITWRAGNVPRGAGILGGAREVAFQVALLPSLSQIGTAPTLINKTYFSAYDTFANINLVSNKNELTTNLVSDPAFNVEAKQDRVVD